MATAGDKLRTLVVSVPPSNTLLFFTGVVLCLSFLYVFPTFQLFFLFFMVLAGLWGFELYSMYEYHFSKKPVSGAVVITGASRGIGKVTALHLQKLGLDVFAGVRNEEDGENLKKEATKDGGQLIPVILDVCDSESIAKAKLFVEQKTGGAGILSLINNAGIVVGFGYPLEFTDEALLKKAFEVNLFGALNVTRAFLPLLHRRNNSRVIFISTMGTLCYTPLVSAYTASKKALEGAVNVLRLELRHFGIHVALVRPGFTQTDMLTEVRDHEVPKLEAPPEQTPPDRLPLYQGLLLRKKKLHDTLISKTTISPQGIADLVEHAVRSNNPRSEYNSAADTLFHTFQLLPTSLLAYLHSTL